MLRRCPDSLSNVSTLTTSSARRCETSMIPLSVALTAKMRFQRLLRTVCFGSLVAGLTVAACSVPQFEFPAEETPQAGTGNTGNTGTAGTGNTGDTGTSGT